MKVRFGSFLIPILLVTSQTEARVSVRNVDPASTAQGIAMIRGPHRVLRDSSVASNGRLLITLGGTGSRPADLDFIQRLAVSLGYSVIAIDYPNTISTVTCETAPSPVCYDDFRNEIFDGTPSSDRVEVDFTNSIDNRIASLVGHLARRDRWWKKFFGVDGSLDWTRVVLAGHSQGAGHVAYLAKHHLAERVIMIAGPVDKSAAGLGPWLSRPGLTPPERFFAFMNESDPFDTPRMTSVVRALFGDPLAPTVTLEREAPSTPERIWITTAASSDPHSSVIGAEFVDVWKALLTR
jgi:pimeloyl-ACP methyl ester carboxylesterase